VIQERLLELYQREKSTPESMEWFNLLIGWLFDQMRDTPAVKEAFFFRPLAESAVDMRRKFMGFLLVTPPPPPALSYLSLSERHCWNNW
jgi:hypothetical protein